MVEQRRGRWLGKVLGGVRPTSEDHRPTTFELFFDLVYVFAATQVTGYMAHEHSGHGVVQGLLLLALLWWTWSAYAWLGNQARVDEGVLRVGMAVAMAAIFVVALTIPEAWHDAPGGLDGPLVLVGAYLLVRCVHFVLYTVAATGDRELRHQLAISSAPLLASAALLVPGALLGGWIQTLLFAGALLVDWGGVYLTAREGSWRLRSARYWTERHGLFIILALGESVVAIGAGAAQKAISAPLLLAAVLGVAAAVGLWWLYFDVASLAAEHRMLEAQGQAGPGGLHLWALPDRRRHRAHRPGRRGRAGPRGGGQAVGRLLCGGAVRRGGVVPGRVSGVQAAHARRAGSPAASDGRRAPGRAASRDRPPAAGRAGRPGAHPGRAGHV